MNIAKRLLNVLTIAAIAAFIYGSGQIILGSAAYSAKQKTHCENEQALRRIQEGRISGQLISIPPHLEADANPKNIEFSINLLEAMCANTRPILNVASPAKTMGTIFLSLLLMVGILNYILFGKVTLWNSVKTIQSE